MVLRSPNITVMSNAAYKAARGLVRDFGEVEQLQVSRKGTADFVSQADLAAEKALRRELEKARPAYGFLMEESGESPSRDGEHRWIVDPLDGTTNYLHGIPHFCISIALERAGEIVCAVIYDPVRDEMFRAEKGVGAYHNDRRMRVSGRRQLADAVIATRSPHAGAEGHETHARQLAAVTAQTAGVRNFGAAALDLAYIAAGRYDGYWDGGLQPWDIAAGLLLVRESGGFVSEVGGGHNMMQSGSILAANDHLHLPLGKLLRKAVG